jgi:pyridoxal phosphate enzyme (YggS family)
MIADNIKSLYREIPEGVEIVAAAKGRSPHEIKEAVEAGIRIIGQNYVQEAEESFRIIGRGIRWHFIGHLQTNKVKKAVAIFDMIETVDSFSLAEEIARRSGSAGRIMTVLIEINSGREPQKSGVPPEEAEDLVRRISGLQNIRVRGLMTMGPYAGDPEEARPYFVETKAVFERLKEQNIPNAEMVHLSMGMTNSYRVAIEEGANIVRIGTKIFGSRP